MGCTAWYLVTTYYYSDGSSSQTSEYLYTTCSGDNQQCSRQRLLDNPNQSFKTSCGGGGGGDQADLNEVNTEVINLLISQCFLQFVNAIGNAKLKNEISKLYQQTFVGYGSTFNIKYTEQANLTFQGGPVAAISGPDINSPNTWVIVLNSDYANLGTRESWGQTILHEVIHGFIRKNDLDFKTTSTWQETHQQMLGNWFDQMKDALIELYNIPEFDAKALAFEGLDDVLKDEVTDTFKENMRSWVQQKYNIDLVSAEAISLKYYTKEKGTSCQ